MFDAVKKITGENLIRHFSFFKLHRTLPANMILFIIKEFIIMNFNAKEITKRIKNKYNYETLTKILLNLKRTIADYLKHIYRIKGIGGYPSTEIEVAVNECMFVMI